MFRFCVGVVRSAWGIAPQHMCEHVVYADSARRGKNPPAPEK